MTHQRHFLPLCNRILVLKHGHQKALGAYSEIASSALSEIAQLEHETELDDAVYDDQIPSGARSAAHTPGQLVGSALQDANAGPVHAKLSAAAPAAAAATASQVTDAANKLSTGQQLDSSLAAPVFFDPLTMPATATTAATAVAPTDAATVHPADTVTAADIQIQSLLPCRDTGYVNTPTQPNSVRQVSGQGLKHRAAFSPAVVQKKKLGLPPRVDLRWGPIKVCERWYDRLIGLKKAHKTKVEDVPEEEEGPAKQQAQLNQQEGRMTGVPLCTLCVQFCSDTAYSSS